jgi:hypothetical protein
MEEQSLFEKLSDSQLKKYMKYFFTIVDDDFDNIKEFMEMDMSIYNKIKAPFAREIDRLDFEYLWYILIHNRRSDILNPDIEIIRPQLENKIITYREEWYAKVSETRRSNVPTYIGDEIDKPYLSYVKGIDWLETWEWDQIDQEIDYTDFIDDDWDIN